jgi:hypothetical protein
VPQLKGFIEEENVSASPENCADQSLNRQSPNVQKLGNEAVNEAEVERPSAMPPSLHPIQEKSAALAGALKVIKKLNRNTTWSAAGLLSCVLFAVLMLAFQDHEQPARDLTSDQATLAGENGSQNLKSTEVSQRTNSLSENASEIAAGPAHSAYPALANANVQPEQKANVISETPFPRQDLRPETGAKVIVKHRSTGGRRFLSAKERLLALWHQSLNGNASNRSWMPFWTSTQGKKKKISYTRKSDH